MSSKIKHTSKNIPVPNRLHSKNQTTKFQTTKFRDKLLQSKMSLTTMTCHYPSISLDFLDFEVYTVCNKEQIPPLQINAASNKKEHVSPTGTFILLFSETFQLSRTKY